MAPVLRTDRGLPTPAALIARTSMEKDASPPAHESTSNETLVLPMIGEVATVGKVAVETGRVEVNKRVEERVETIATPTTREQYVVERCWINEVVESGARTAIRQEGDTTVFPILEEIVVVEKRLVLKEELRVTRVRTQSHATETVTLRTERADVTRHDASGHPAATGNER